MIAQSPSKRNAKTRGFYVPVNFDPKIHLPLELQDHEDSANYILNLIHQRRVINGWSPETFVPLKADYLREVVPDWSFAKSA